MQKPCRKWRAWYQSSCGFVAFVAAQVTPQGAPSAAAPFEQGESREAGHRSQIRIRDPFVPPDRDEKVY